MGRIGNIAGLFGDVKTRTIVIFTTVLLAIGVGVGITGLKQETVATGGATTASVPRNIQNVPGAGTATAQYEALQLEENRRKLEAARQSGTSAIPTLTGTFTKVELPTEEEIPPPTTGETLTVQERIARQQAELQSRIAVQRAEQEAQQRIQRQQQFQAETRDNFGKNMGKQAKTFLNGWAKSSNQEYVEGQRAKQDKDNGDGNGNGQGNRGVNPSRSSLGGGAGGSSRAENLAKAGDMIFAVLETEIDSDDKGPVIATVVSGKMKGSKVIGAYELTDNKQRIILKFSQMNMPKADSTISINAVAVNPFNGRTGLASSVDNHFIKRYGSLFVASMLQGYGESIKDQGNKISISPQGTSITEKPTRTTNDEIFIALSQVGTTLGAKADTIFDTPPTVKVKEGVGLGILFLADVTSAGAGL